ncbi:MAG: tRNA lysidine(34) synthetase TilS [Treponemataceae bacterium]|nr:tRNA lysidine(34) synthetase TilS [Treponemataceae bacterium]
MGAENLEEEVSRFERIVADNLFQSGASFEKATLLVGVSGGADSIALLLALYHLQVKLDYTLHCVHVNHNLRGEESTRDALFVKDFCAIRQIPCTVVKIPAGSIERWARKKKSGIEAAARYVRYRIFKKNFRRFQANFLLLGHTKSDVLETLLMRILRGSGPAGLSPMPVRRGPIIRPLLTFERYEIEHYLKNQGISYRTDSTNQDTHYLRNAIRHLLIPVLEQYFPFWKSSILSLGETQRMVYSYVVQEVRRQLSWEENPVQERPLCSGTPNSRCWGLRTGANAFWKLPPLLQEEALFQGIDRLLRKEKKERCRFLRPDPVSFLWSVPKRKGIRTFLREKPSRAMLGPCVVWQDGAYVYLQGAQSSQWSGGAVLFVSSPGCYSFNGITITLSSLPQEGALAVGETQNGCSGEGDRERSALFVGYLPLLIRYPYPEDRLLYRGKKRSMLELLGDKKKRGLQLVVFEDREGIAGYLVLDIHSKIQVWQRDASYTEKEGAVPVLIHVRGSYVG